MSQRRWAVNTFPWLEDADSLPPAKVRVIVDNDFSGDPDDLYQMAHHLLSPAVEIRGIIASHLGPGDVLDPGPNTATNARRRLEELLEVMGVDADGLLYTGAEEALVDPRTPHDTPAARAIVAEAMRDDPRPLLVCCGAGLTDLASAWLLEPRIAERVTVVWIGGPEHPGLASPWPAIGDPEYNLAIDVPAGRTVVGESDLRLWIVPRDMYRQCLVSDVELRRRVRPHGELGRFLYDSLRQVAEMTWESGEGFSETYALGDSPLVLLSALQSFFQPDTSSSDFAEVPAPRLDENGSLAANPLGRPVRVYTRLDTRLMFEDMFTKIEIFSEWAGR